MSLTGSGNAADADILWCFAGVDLPATESASPDAPTLASLLSVAGCLYDAPIYAADHAQPTIIAS